MMGMTAPKINPGDVIGIPCISHVATPAMYGHAVYTLSQLGFRVKMGAHASHETYGYAASAEERAADFNDLFADPEVKMLLFGGGESAAEVLPYIDYEWIKQHPKPICSYSDGTTIVNMVYARTGLITYYGQGGGQFDDLRLYDWQHFLGNFVAGHAVSEFLHGGGWQTLHGGEASGVLIGGYPDLFAMLLGHRHFAVDLGKKYILFFECPERFVNIGAAATALAFIEQSPFGDCIAGLLVGHYADPVPKAYLDIFHRFGVRRRLPVVYCDDFGHGNRHGILPIGMTATLDADGCSLLFEGGTP
jgi:muramoyltetrapeptide carboxypeptidase